MNTQIDEQVCGTCSGTGEGEAPFVGYDKGVCPRCNGTGKGKSDSLEVSDAEHARDVVSAFLIRLSELRPRTQRIMALDGDDYVLDAQDLRVLLGEIGRLQAISGRLCDAINEAAEAEGTFPEGLGLDAYRAFHDLEAALGRSS